MKASLAGAAATFNALPTQMAQLAEALRVKREAAEAGNPAPDAGAAPAADTAPDAEG
jgi:large subunit ribosomal protein L10